MSAEEYLARRQAQFNQGDFIGCLADLDQLFRDPQITPEQVRPIWNEFMLGPKQLLLRATRQASKSCDRTTIDATSQTIERLFGSFDLTRPPQTVARLLKPHDKLSFHALFEAQLHLVDVFLSEFDQSEIKARLGYAIDKLAEAWGFIDYDAQKSFGLPYADAESTGQLSRASADHDYPPAFWNQLRPKWQTILSKFGLPHSVGWSHPAFLAVAQWIAWLLSDEDELMPRCEHSATTQIALMSEAENGLLEGVLGRLTVERIPGGRRFVYPDPLRSGGFLCDTIFAESIHRAVQVALGKELAVALCDFRWSLVIEDSLNHPIYTSLTGRSGDVAIAAALRAAARDETLDGHVVVTAQFADTSSVNPPLKPVQGIVAKLLGLRETLHGAAVAKHVDELIVSRKQPEATDPATRASLGADVQTGRIHLTPADDFNAAYEQLALFPRLTAHVKAALHARSGELLGKLCNPYL
ncbi:MAG: hypothetical protein JNM18_01155, partial [Planctomycetaceae bacterium]|nr:hypothetical protein [Planctomycetaceae bacterium]